MTNTVPRLAPPMLKSWLTLAALQIVLALLLLLDFLSGARYFAYLDIGSDTYVHTAHAMRMAREIAREGWTDWSFSIGLGAPTAWMGSDLFIFLMLLGGAEHVLPIRIWVYLLKIALGGLFFLALARPLVRRPEAAIAGALAYSFCGYVVANGQWDSEGGAFVFFPLLLWAISRHLRTGAVLAIPLTVMASLLAGVFFAALAVSLVIACGAWVVLSDSPRSMLRSWVIRVLPLAAIGFLLASPHVLPVALQLLDSPRIGQSGSMLDRLMSDGLKLSSSDLLIAQIAAFFPKPLLGTGNAHDGYLNYLESPVFYIGLLPLLVIPQLWRGSSKDRRALVIGLCAIGLYITVPLLRMAAFGFSAPYFRLTTLWVTLGLALLAVRGFDHILGQRRDTRMLAAGGIALVVLLALALWSYWRVFWMPYAVHIALLSCAAFTLLALPVRVLKPRFLGLALIAAIAMEIAVLAPPSFFMVRWTASPQRLPFRDMTMEALAEIRRRDTAVFRIEKTYTSFSMADAVAQDYMGVKSYYYHGKAVANFHTQTDLLPFFPNGRPVNFTNWLAPPANRYMLHSLLGVKYLITRQSIDWPGFEAAFSGRDYTVYRNGLAMPLGIVQSQQVTQEQLRRLDALSPNEARQRKDAVLVNAVVLDMAMPEWGASYDLEALARKPSMDLQQDYARPAAALQRTGLELTAFSNHGLKGRIRPETKGILVFSIPFYDGWSLTIDGQPAPLIRANFGMLAAPVTAGPHEIALTYRLPGRIAGLWAALGGLALLALGWLVSRRQS